MKKVVLVAILLAGAGAFFLIRQAGKPRVSHLPPAAFDVGGVTFDFRAISERRFGADGKPRAAAPQGFPIDLLNRPFGYLDGRFAVSRGQCGVVSFGWSITSRFPCCPTKDFRFEIVVPQGYRVIGTTFGEVATRRARPLPDGTTRVTAEIREGLRPDGWMNNQRPLNVLVEADDAAGEGKMTLVVTDKAGKAMSPTAEVTLYAVDPVRAGAAPKRFHNGFDSSLQLYFREDAAYDQLARLFGDIGAGWLVQLVENNAFVPYWRKYAHGPVTPFWESLADGFHIGPTNGLAEADRFVCDPSSPRLAKRPGRVKFLRDSPCPVTVYTEGEHFRRDVVPELKRLLAGTDGMWSNWEPSMYYKNGCWCDRCRAAFAAWSKRSAADVEANWPKAVQEGGKWAKEGTRFRSWQHARVVRTVDKVVREATGGEKSIGFVPGVASVEMSSYWLRKGYPEEMLQVDYAGDLRWINPWGPYVRWEADKPYRYEKRKPLLNWISAIDVQKTLLVDHPNGPRPKLLSYPQGQQCGNWVTQPEHIAQAMDAYFVNGWGANCVYYFPNGYDARYLKVFADATRRAAIGESFVLDGEPADGKVALRLTEPFAAPSRFVSAWLPDWKDMSLVQMRAFDHGGARLVAVLNFWDGGTAFFKLSCGGLKGGRYSVIADGVAWVKDPKTPTWTAEELSAGIDLAVGAARTSFFEIRPESDRALDKARSLMTADALRRLADELRPALAKAAEADAALEKTLPKPKMDWMGLE